MGYELEDGQGSRNKVAVFANKARTLADESSLMNHISSEADSVPTGGDPFPGVYSARISGSFGFGHYGIYGIQNTDPENLVVIDRAYAQVISISPGTLPSSGDAIFLLNSFLFFGSPITLTPVNDNQAIQTSPNIISLTNFSTPGFGATNRIFPILGEIMELIPQESDGTILGFGNQFGILYLSSTLNTVFVNAYVRFAMVPPGNME